jgi:hypothetical protein
MALDGDDKAVPDLGMMGNYEWDSEAGSAGVDADKHPDDHAMAGEFTAPAGANATITGKSRGEATISAAIEGQSATVGVNVSGSVTLRGIVYSAPGTQTFVWNQDQVTQEWDGDEMVATAVITETGGAGSVSSSFDQPVTTADLVSANNVYTSFTVELIKTRGDTQDTSFEHDDLTITSNVTSGVGLRANWHDDGNGVVTVYVLAGEYGPDNQGASPVNTFSAYVYDAAGGVTAPVFAAGAAPVAGDGPGAMFPATPATAPDPGRPVEVILTLSATGADKQIIRFVIDISKRERSY